MIKPSNWRRNRFLAAITLTLTMICSVVATAEEEKENNPQDEELPEINSRVIEPNIRLDAGKAPDIDSEKWEATFYLGSYKFDGFPARPFAATRLAYHMNYFMFAEATFGQTDLDQSTLTKVGRETVAEDDKATIYALDLGINFLNGQLFYGANRALTSDLYLTFGFGRLNLDENDYTSINFAGGARALINDWASVRMEFRSHLLEESFLEPDELSHNIEFVIGLGIIF